MDKRGTCVPQDSAQTVKNAKGGQMTKGLSTGMATLFLAVSLSAQNVAPNEVRVFKHPDFVGDSASYKVEAGMRHKLASSLGNLDNAISSILVGSDVAIMAFGNPGFDSILPGPALGETQKLLPAEWNDSISSLVVFRKKDFGELLSNRDPYGVYLIKLLPGNRGQFRFIPLPEEGEDVETRHALLGADWDDQVSDIQMGRKVEITLFDGPKFQGEPLYLPGASPNLVNGVGVASQLSFHLGKYDFSNRASSLIVRVYGAPPETPERTGGGTGATHRAPPAGEAAKPVEMKLGTIKLEPIDISGIWKSNIGLVYDISQNKDKFTWRVRGQSQIGEGTIAGDSVNVIWTDPKGRGGAQGKITLDRSGKAVRIQWSNGVVFTR